MKKINKADTIIKHTIVLLSCFSVTLFANDNWYGSSTEKKTIETDNTIDKNKKIESAFQYTGGYKQNENVSWEASYTDFGSDTNINLENTKVEKSTNSYSVNGKFSILDKDDIKTNFKVGLHRWEQALNKSKEKGADIFYGVGVDIPLSKQISATTNFETYKLKGSNLDKMSIGFTYKF